MNSLLVTLSWLDEFGKQDLASCRNTRHLMRRAIDSDLPSILPEIGFMIT